MKKENLWVPFLTAFFLCFSLFATQNPLLWDNTADYTYMWWASGFRDSGEIFNIQTSRFGLSFDYDDFEILTFGPILNPPDENQALTQDNSLIDSLPAAGLRCSIGAGGSLYDAVSADQGKSSCMLVESGKYFQRRWLDDITVESGAPAGQMNLEIAAWPDRISFVLYFKPDAAVTNGALEIELDLESAFSNELTSGTVKALTNGANSGYIFTSDHSGAQITCDGIASKCTLHLDIASWQAGIEQAVALIVYPVADNCSGQIGNIANAESSLLTINAQQVKPIVRGLPSYYQKRYGWYHVGLRNDSCGSYSESGNNRIERVNFSVTNPDTQPREIRLSFYKQGNVCQVTGLSAMLCDDQYVPLGIPVQLSKNWHNGDLHRFDEFTWFRGATMLTIPAQTTVDLNYTSVGTHWGGVAAASHAQLCLIGWSDVADRGNQLWEESAIGSWGESITYDPDVNLGRAMIDDVRPVMVYAKDRDTPEKWTWTNNVGGADFLCYWDSYGNRKYNSRMRTQYKKYCPVLTEVTYAGQGGGGAIEMQCTTQVYRTDDIVRGVYRMRYDVTSAIPVDATPSGNNRRIAFFQLGADNYNNHNFEKIARGNADGLIEEWSPVKGGNSYSRVAIPCTGQTPWFSLHEANSNDTSLYGAWANRGLVIRKYQARLGGVENDIPNVSVYGTENGGYPSANVELGVPNAINQLVAGDYLEAEIVYVIMPQNAGDYYGPNAELEAALTGTPDGWEMIHREAVGNDLEINMIHGKLLREYPVQIRACNGLEFEITGGLGYVPMTFENLCDYENCVLEEYVNENWVAVDQAVHGNDFWQCNYDPDSQTWSRTYSVKLDTASDVPTTRRFRLSGSCLSYVPSDLNCDARINIEDVGILSLEWLMNGQTEPAFQDRCIGWWKFDETAGSTAYDSSGLLMHGQVNTSFNWIGGHLDNALDFTGSTSVSIPVSAVSGLTDQVSICLWVYGDPAEQPENQDVVFHANGPDQSRILLCHLPWTDGRVIFDAGYSDGGYDRILKDAQPGDYEGKWNHWAFTKNTATGNMRIYLNGQIWHNGSGKIRDLTGITEFNIGSYTGGGGGYYEGAIDDFRIYNIELNAAEIWNIYEGQDQVGCDQIQADLTGDCKVDFLDFYRLAFDWLYGI